MGFGTQIDDDFVHRSKPHSKGSGLPDAVKLASLVSNVTEPVTGTRFSPAVNETRGQSICGRMVMLPIKGARDISVVLSCDIAASRALAAALRGCRDNELTSEMIDDGIAELLNMVAGQIQGELEIDQPLGLPRITSFSELAAGGEVSFDDSILLSSDSLGDLKLWVFERTVSTGGHPPRLARGVRSLFRKMFRHS